MVNLVWLPVIRVMMGVCGMVSMRMAQFGGGVQQERVAGDGCGRGHPWEGVGRGDGRNLSDRTLLGVDARSAALHISTS